MKKEMAKNVVLVLVLCMLLAAAFTGCGSKTIDEKGTTPDVEDQTDNSTGNDGEDQEPAEPEITLDMGGRTISYSAWWDPAPVAGSSQWADLALARMDNMQEKYNFKMEWLNIPWDQYLENYTASALAGDPMSDIAAVGSYWFFPTLVVNGFVAPLSDLEAFDFSEEKWTPATLSYGTYKGKIYGMGTGRFFPRAGVYWNKTLFEREGLPNLYELQNNKQWTWDKMLEIAKKATKDLDGDGVIDQWGMEASELDWPLVYSNNAKVFTRTEDGGLNFTLTEPNAIEALQFLQDLYQVHKVVEIPPDGASWEYPIQRFQDGVAAMNAGQWWLTDRYAPNMADDYGFVVFPMGPKATDYVHLSTETNLDVIAATAEKPEDLAVIWNEYTDPYPELEEDTESWREVYEQKARDAESVDTIDMLQNDMKTEFCDMRNFPEVEQLSWNFMWQIRTGNKTPQTAIDEIAQQAQTILDDAMSATQQ